MPRSTPLTPAQRRAFLTALYRNRGELDATALRRLVGGLSAQPPAACSARSRARPA
jgi:hypothetical protein